MKVLIINGPNLNLLGTREPDIYGTESFEQYLEALISEFTDLDIEYYQSNVEGELINKLQETGFSYSYILLNAGGYTHTSVALGDAVAAIETPVIEIHISNPQAREEFRQASLISKHALGIISGFGLNSYKMGIQFIVYKEAVSK